MGKVFTETGIRTFYQVNNYDFSAVKLGLYIRNA